MLSPRFARQSLVLICLLALSVYAQAAKDAEYQPQEGQPGRDVMWIPTCQVLVNKMLDMAKVTAQDYVIDLGSGDGRLVITAAKRGVRALGIEYNAGLVALSKRRAAEEGVDDKARFIKADIFESDFSQATVVTMFLLDELNLQLRPQLLNLKPGTRIVSNTFTMGEWKPDQTASLKEKDCSEYFTALLWVVPAKVEGSWTLPQGELTLRQEFQAFSGTLKSGSKVSPVNGKLNGDHITFRIENKSYTGRVSGSTMEGTVEAGGSTANWTAIQTIREPPR
jgi:hypothetical protein